MIVVEQSSAPPSLEALTDSMVARVIEWDRMPLTDAWVRENEGARQNLASLGKWNLPRLIEWRWVASGYLTAAADRFTVSACS